ALFESKNDLSSRDVDCLLGQSALHTERHVAVNQCKQGVILAHANVLTGVELGAALTHDDGTSCHQLATKGLHAQHFWLGITSVARRAAAFFLCHDLAPSELSGNRHNLQLSELLAMALGFSVVLTATQLEDAYLVVLAMSNHCCLHRCAG